MDMAANRDAEFRVVISADLMQRIDAVSTAAGYPSRREWFEAIAEREVNQEIHRATVLLRMCRINPLLPDGHGKGAE